MLVGRDKRQLREMGTVRFSRLLEEKSEKLRVLGGNAHHVAMSWDLNARTKRDQIFKLTVDEKTVLLSKQQLMSVIRAV